MRPIDSEPGVGLADRAGARDGIASPPASRPRESLITRFLALYDERRDKGRLLGVIVLEAGTVLLLGGAAIIAAWTLRGSLAGSLTSDTKTFEILLALMALSTQPIGARHHRRTGP
jgi:hypothetical protein